MRLKLLTYTLLAAIAGAVFWACRHDRFGHRDPNAVEPTLTVNEARDFFEYQFSELAPYMTKVTGDRPVGMLPGDFTPLWNKARIGANPEMDGADVPIDPKFIFVAVFRNITPEGDTLRRTVDVTQKLVVKKWRNTDEYEAFCYIASIVPTPEHYAKNKNTAKEFQYAGSKGSFSGFVVYHTLTGRLVGVDNYRNGQRTRHDYFPQVTDRNADSVLQVMQETVGTTTFQGGTPMMFMAHTEEDDPLMPDEDVTVTAPKPKPDFPDRPGGLPTDPVTPPPYNPDYNDGGNPGGGGGGSNPNTSNTPSVSTLFNAQGFTASEIAEINSILSKLSDIGISNKVLTQLMAKGKITLKKGTEEGHEQSFAVYALQTNTLTINLTLIENSSDKEVNLRNAVMEETFHAYQYLTYGNQFNQRCYEFEAKVYGTIIINQYGGPPVYLNPMDKNGLGNIFGQSYFDDIKRMTGNFTHGINSGDMTTLYQDYGGFCTQYPLGDPNWEFKALPGL